MVRKQAAVLVDERNPVFTTNASEQLNMSNADIHQLYGEVCLEPRDEVVAGSYGTWTLTYTAGKKGIATGGRIRIYTDSDSDRATPQMDDSAGADYLTIEAPKATQIGVLVQSVLSVVLVVNGRALEPGEQVAVTYGDRSKGGPGFRSQTFQEARHYFWVDVDSAGDGTSVTLPEPPYLSIVGGTAEKLVVTLPSTVRVGEQFQIQVRAEDAWGNPAAAYRGTVAIQSEAVKVPTERLTFNKADKGVQWIEGCTVTQTGVHRLTAADEKSGLTAQSNPTLCEKTKAPYNLYWGDSHGGQIAMAEKIPDFFQYARDVAAIHFAGYQRNDHVLSKRDWALQQAAERTYDQPGRFVALPGYEWSANTSRGGHHNVYFRRHDQPIRRSDHGGLEDKSDADTDLYHIQDVYEAFRNSDTVITAHVGGEHSDLTYHDPALEPAVEVTSDHGTFEWILEEALQRNYKMGFFGGSDSHNGRPGNDTPGFQHRRYSKAGLAAVYAPELTISDVLSAYKAKRIYATTGARILMHTEAAGHLMGTEFTTSEKPQITVFIAGTAPFESVELFRGLERIYNHPVDCGADSNRVRILWEGASRKSSYSGVIWEGKLMVTGRRVANVDKIRFDSPRSRVFDVEDYGLRWYSVTCGYRSGIILDLVGDNDGELELVVNTSVITGPLYGESGINPPRRMSYAPAEKVAVNINLTELKKGPVTMEIGGLNRRVTVSLAPTPQDAGEVKFSFADPSPNPGINPYWVRVVQTDMEMAWSSPIYVDHVAQ
ncbi:hypothetical protein C6502_11245 [Candidatus Poribacteria bacterium]|nr:MAG: hypothetical protein C6502_11245 [Candidatus Poribacteria bacterium]